MRMRIVVHEVVYTKLLRGTLASNCEVDTARARARAVSLLTPRREKVGGISSKRKRDLLNISRRARNGKIYSCTVCDRN